MGDVAIAGAVVGFTQELVRIPSVLGDEHDVAVAVAEEMRRLAFDHVEIDEAGNAIGVIECGAAGPTLLFDGHLDTIGIAPREAWTHDPFGGEIIGGRMYGRGTSDMKGAVAAMVHGAALVDRKKARGRIVVSGSVGEEVVEGPALRAVMARYPADYVVIGESTELKIARAGRGRAEFVITTHGKPAHASTPELGENAILKMLRVIEALEKLPMGEHTIAGRALGVITDVISNPYPAHSVIPNACRATYERRTLPGEEAGAIVLELERAAASVGAGDTRIEAALCEYTTYTGVHWTQAKWFPAWITDEGSKLVERARAGLRVAGLGSELSHYNFCTNAAYSAGVADVPTIGYGPSSEKLAHVVDEYVEVEQLEWAAQGYRAIAEGVLGAR